MIVNDCLLKALWWSSHWPPGVNSTAPCHFFNYEQGQNVHNRGLPSSFIKTVPGWRVQFHNSVPTNNNNNNPVVAFEPLFRAELTLSWRRTLCQKKNVFSLSCKLYEWQLLCQHVAPADWADHHSTAWLKESYHSAQGHVLRIIGLFQMANRKNDPFVGGHFVVEQQKKKMAIISLLSSSLWLLSLPLSLAPPLLL